MKIVTILAILLSGCVTIPDDPILYTIEENNKKVRYIHESGRITDQIGNVIGYIE